MKSFSLHKILLLVADILVINFSFYFTLWLKYRSGIYFPVVEFPFHFLPVFLLGSLVLVLFFQLHSLYKYQLIENSYNQFIAIAKSMVNSYVLLIAFIFMVKHELVLHRVTLLLSFVILGLFLILYRIVLIPKIYKNFMASGKVKKDIIIVGAGERGQRLAKAINEKEDSYFRVMGFVDDKSEFHGKEFHGIPVLGAISSLQAIAQDRQPDALLVTINSVSNERLLQIIDQCRRPAHSRGIGLVSGDSQSVGGGEELIAEFGLRK